MKNDQRKTPPKDHDMARLTHFIRASGWALPFLGLLGVILGYVRHGITGALLGGLAAMAVSLTAGFLIVLLTDAIGGTASGLLFGRRRAVWTVREQIHGTLNQARFSRENSDYPQALAYINKVLSKDSEYPEALLLKAEILWDGFQELEIAKRFLEKVLTIDFKDRVVYNRAESLYDILVRTDTPVRRGARPTGLEIGIADNLGSTIRKIAGTVGDNIKQALQERKAVDWAVIGIILFAFISLLASFILGLNVKRLDTSIETSGGIIERVRRTTETQAYKIQKIDTAANRMASQVKEMEKNIKNN